MIIHNRDGKSTLVESLGGGIPHQIYEEFLDELKKAGSISNYTINKYGDGEFSEIDVFIKPITPIKYIHLECHVTMEN